MKEIVSKEYMHAMDEKACKDRSINSYTLMKEAGTELAKTLDKTVLRPGDVKTVLVVAGIGHNGGDALVMADYLDDRYLVSVAICGHVDKMHPDVKAVYERLVDKKDIHCLEEATDCEKLPSTDVIIDGVFGLGIARPVSGIYHSVIEWMNQSSASVVSIDIPSGLDANSGKIWGISVQADYTLVVQALKYGHVMYQGKDNCGKIITVDVGIPIESNTDVCIEPHDYHQSLPLRKAYSNKYDYGSLATFGGNIGMLGAPHLTAYAALRAGIGLSSLYVRESVYPNVSMLYPEIMVAPCKNVKHCLHKKSVLVFGPGLGKDDSSLLKTLQALIHHPAPLIIDADGLYYFNQLKDNVLIDKPIIITPHSGEMAQFFDITSDMFEANWTHYLQGFLEKYPVTVLLKGPTMVIANSKAMHFVDEAGPELARGGSGDVLGGIIAAFIPKVADPFEATTLAALVLAKAGKHAKVLKGEEGIIATDLIEALPEVIKPLKVKCDMI